MPFRYERAGDDLDQADLVRPPLDATAPRPVSGNARAFRVLVRDAMFRRVELAGRRDRATLGELDRDAGWDADAWEDAMAPYWDEHPTLLTDARARGPALLMIDDSTEPGVCMVRQILHDPESYHDWAFLASVDLAASDEAGYAVVRLGGVSCGYARARRRPVASAHSFVRKRSISRVISCGSTQQP